MRQARRTAGTRLIVEDRPDGVLLKQRRSRSEAHDRRLRLGDLQSGPAAHGRGDRCRDRRGVQRACARSILASLTGCSSGRRRQVVPRVGTAQRSARAEERDRRARMGMREAATAVESRRSSRMTRSGPRTSKSSMHGRRAGVGWFRHGMDFADAVHLRRAVMPMRSDVRPALRRRRRIGASRPVSAPDYS